MYLSERTEISEYRPEVFGSQILVPVKEHTNLGI